jgi:hypothetical protein
VKKIRSRHCHFGFVFEVVVVISEKCRKEVFIAAALFSPLSRLSPMRAALMTVCLAIAWEPKTTPSPVYASRLLSL